MRPSLQSPAFRPGFDRGVAISLAVKTGKAGQPKLVRYRDDIDEAKAKDRRQQLLDSLSITPFDDQYEIADPQDWNKLSFRPNAAGADYRSWPMLNELSAIAPINGLMEKRGGTLIDIDKTALTTRMQTYFNPKVDWAAYMLLGERLASDAARFDAKAARTKALASSYSAGNVVRYFTRPFDIRHAYFTDIRPIWNEPRPDLWAQFSGGNRFIVSRPSGVANPEGAPIIFTTCLGDNDAQRGHSYYLPFVHKTPSKGLLSASNAANLSAKSRVYLAHLGLPDPDTDAGAQAAIWHHTLAISYAPKYLSDNADGLSIDWPRIPLPDDAQLLLTSADLGARIAALLNTEADVVGITSGSVADHLKEIGIISANDLRVAAGWGSKDSKNRVNPGRGKTQLREWSDAEITAMKPGFTAIGMSDVDAFALLGKAVDVYLNDKTFWRGVPEAVWNYHIGGYQVLKKWLSYREEGLLGRHLNKEEAREVTNMTRRITALILMCNTLDKNYAASQAKSYSW